MAALPLLKTEEEESGVAMRLRERTTRDEKKTKMIKNVESRKGTLKNQEAKIALLRSYIHQQE